MSKKWDLQTGIIYEDEEGEGEGKFEQFDDNNGCGYYCEKDYEFDIDKYIQYLREA